MGKAMAARGPVEKRFRAVVAAGLGLAAAVGGCACLLLLAGLGLLAAVFVLGDRIEGAFPIGLADAVSGCFLAAPVVLGGALLAMLLALSRHALGGLLVPLYAPARRERRALRRARSPFHATELIAACRPVGTGLELEASPAPGGRGTELSAGSPE